MRITDSTPKHETFLEINAGEVFRCNVVGKVFMKTSEGNIIRLEDGKIYPLEDHALVIPYPKAELFLGASS